MMEEVEEEEEEEMLFGSDVCDYVTRHTEPRPRTRINVLRGHTG